MEKLELKHLAPYLPYDIMAIDLNTKEIRKVTLLHFTYTTISVGHNHLIYEGILLSKHLPILRPLSDLTKEIEVNGEKFLPIERIKKMYPSDTFSSTANLAKWSYRIIEKLCEWHFDIFGLIEKGLAVDINTLNN